MYKLQFEFKDLKNDTCWVLFRIFKDEETMYKFIKENNVKVIHITELEWPKI